MIIITSAERRRLFFHLCLSVNSNRENALIDRSNMEQETFWNIIW